MSMLQAFTMSCISLCVGVSMASVFWFLVVCKWRRIANEYERQANQLLEALIDSNRGTK